MRDKRRKEQILQEDLIKYSKQIGIVDCEIPTLMFNVKEYVARRRDGDNKQHWYHLVNKGMRKQRTGECTYADRLIFIHTHRQANLRSAKHSLIHELVHYRFNIRHGPKFEQTIKDIQNGQTYPRKHIDIPNLSKPWNAFN